MRQFHSCRPVLLCIHPCWVSRPFWTGEVVRQSPRELCGSALVPLSVGPLLEPLSFLFYLKKSLLAI